MCFSSIDIVIIGRNEGKLLHHAFKSSILAADELVALGFQRPQIIYVDGLSTDDSLTIAAKYTEVNVHSVDDKPNPAKGRHVGFRFCNAEFVFFLDGDMEVKLGWLPTAIAYLKNNPKVAGVAGYCDWEVLSGNRIINIPNHSGIEKNGQLVTTDVGGGFLYRRSILVTVGDFDPSMVRGGEFELYLRIISKGFHLAYITVPMSIHRDHKGSLGRNFIKQSILTRNIFIPGVVARKAPKNSKVFLILLRRYWLYFWHPLSIFSILVIGILYNSTNSIILLSLGILDFMQLLLSHYYYKNKIVKRALISLITINFYIPAFVIGFLFEIPDIGGYYSRTSIKESQ